MNPIHSNDATPVDPPAPQARAVARSGAREAARDVGHLRRLLHLVAGWLCVALGLAGVVLPLLPTTVFFILAAWFFTKGSPRLRQRLLDHPRVGPSIRKWEADGAIARPIKRIAIGMMAATLALCALLGLPLWVLGVQCLCMSGAALYILTRPD